MKGQTAGPQGDPVTVLDKVGPGANLYGSQAGVGKGWLRVLQRIKTRRVLSQLTDDELKDVGLSRSQAAEEARRPFWK
ncbi:DUF1127 domain-containing protein [Pseudomonas sp. TTU2014-080ASC]|uniref:DUF1127 domain-containing protein n=1 Tax=Pseudomonas sp. TTU2014-080ASC TaxID=1729724 RepID=UPI0009ECB8E6|nr:DUF1127 domain-containing protein [Pseudomonas sp. TTU2014-080ASC]